MDFYAIPALARAAAQDGLNQFLTQDRVVAIEKQWLAGGSDAHWAVCVTVASGAGPLPAALKLPSSKGGRSDKADYREVLSPDDFVLFAVLRSTRQTMASQEGVPPYALFTNEQLANIARQRPHRLEALRRIDGIGEARAGKYGPAFLTVVNPPEATAGQCRDATWSVTGGGCHWQYVRKSALDLRRVVDQQRQESALRVLQRELARLARQRYRLSFRPELKRACRSMPDGTGVPGLQDQVRFSGAWADRPRPEVEGTRGVGRAAAAPRQLPGVPLPHRCAP